jgi:hypothetical protein
MPQLVTQISKYSVRDAPVEPAPIPPEDIIEGRARVDDGDPLAHR